MKRIVRLVLGGLVALLLASAPLAAADSWTVDPAHSEVAFHVRHLFSQVRGGFHDFDGKIVYDREHPERSSVVFTIRATSIDTGVDKRDEHLRSADFFDVANDPEIRFESQRVVAVGPGRLSVTGQLTMHGISRTVVLPVRFLGSAKDPWGQERAGFATSTTLDRKEWGIVWNKALDQGGSLLGDDVEVEINLEATRG